MSEVALRPLIDQELEQQAPRDKEKLVAKGVYGRILQVLAVSDVEGLVPKVPFVEGKGRAAVIRLVDAKHVERAQEVIRQAVQDIVAGGVENFQWSPSEII